MTATLERNEAIENVDDEDDSETLTMDEERQRRNVRIFVQRLNEVRNWMAECLGNDNVPASPMQLEESLRCGVMLAKLAHKFAPDLVPHDKIFDIDETRLVEHGLQYRHSDNTNLWRQACIAYKLREIVLPDPVDVYCGRNVRTIFALIALAKRLNFLGKAPPIREQVEHVEITEEEYKAIGERIVDEDLTLTDAATSFAAYEAPSNIDITQEEEEKEEEVLQVPFVEYYDDEDMTTPEYDVNAVRLDAMKQEVDEAIEINFVPDSALACALRKVDAEAAHDLLTSDKPSIDSLRALFERLSNPVADIYGSEQELERRKTDLNKTLESNAALRHQLREIEDYICLIVANVRGMKENVDAKEEKKRKKEIQHAAKMSHSITNLSVADSAMDDTSICGEESYAPSSASVLSHQTIEQTQADERLRIDAVLEAKVVCVELLKMGVAGATIRDLTSTSGAGADEEIVEQIEKFQRFLQQELITLVDASVINDAGGYSELVTMIAMDIRDEKKRADACDEKHRLAESSKADATAEAGELINRIETYAQYKERCLKRMEGGTPDINFAALNKKAGKVLNKIISHKKKTAKPLELNAEQMIKKKLLFMEDETTPKQVENYVVCITPINEPGAFTVEAKLGREVVKSRTLTFEGLLRHEQAGDYRLEFGPLVFDCVGLRRYLNRKFYLKNFN